MKTSDDYASSGSPAQDMLELHTSIEAIEKLTALRMLIANVGPSNPQTSHELDTHLDAALAAASHWCLEKRFQFGDVPLSPDDTLEH